MPCGDARATVDPPLLPSGGLESVCRTPPHCLSLSVALSFVWSTASSTSLTCSLLWAGNLGFAGASSVARALKDHRLTGLTELRLHKGGLWANGFREICQVM